MVKGITKQVIMVDSPDPSMFEKAIFIIKDGKKGASREELLREAQTIAENYLKGNFTKSRKTLSPMFYTAIGAALTGMAWLCVRFIF